MSGLQTSQAIGGVGGCTHSWDVSIGEAVVSSAPRGWPGDSPSKGRMVPKLLHLAALGRSLGHHGVSWECLGDVLGVGSYLLGSVC